MGVSPLTEKKVKPSNNSAVCDHLFHCNFLPSSDSFGAKREQKVFNVNSRKPANYQR